MRNMRIIKSIFIMMVLITCYAFIQVEAEENIINEFNAFYNGLADIIENNMETPDKCVDEVNYYYLRNTKTIEKIRKLTEKSINKVKALAGEYDAEKLKSAEEIEKMQKNIDVMTNPLNEVPEASLRYNNALEKFAVKYPMHAVTIAAKAMELMPKSVFGPTTD